MVKVKVYGSGKGKDKKRKFLNPDLPDPVFRWLLCGSSGSGKSTVIKNVLLNKKNFGYAKYFDEIYLWIANSDDYKFFKDTIKKRNIKNIKLFREFKPNELQQLFKEIEEEAEEKENNNEQPDRILMVFDDMVLQGITSRGSFGILDDIYIRGRHFGISVIISSQKYSMINQNMRKDNCSHITLYYPMNTEELKTIWSENINAYDRNEFIDLFKKNCNKRYSFINIDKLNPDAQLRDNKFEAIIR